MLKAKADSEEIVLEKLLKKLANLPKNRWNSKMTFEGWFLPLGRNATLYKHTTSMGNFKVTISMGVGTGRLEVEDKESGEELLEEESWVCDKLYYSLSEKVESAKKQRELRTENTQTEHRKNRLAELAKLL